MKPSPVLLLLWLFAFFPLTISAETTIAPDSPFWLSQHPPEEELPPPEAVSTPLLATYTYARCYYSLNQADKPAATTWLWAKMADNKEWFKVYGYWWSDHLYQIKNLFYTRTSQEELDSVCEQTLRNNNISQPLLSTAVANNRLSVDYHIWYTPTSLYKGKLA
ncbi:MAG: hypothetical protein ACRC5A_04005 [Enterobacteriaceae bacterium]